MILGLSGRLNSEGRMLEVPLVVHIDEGHNALFEGIEDLFGKARSSNIWVHFYTQSLALMEEAVGEKAAMSIIDNINTWIFMRLNDPRTAKWVSSISPTARVFRGMVDELEDGDVRMRDEVVQFVSPDIILNRLPKRHFLMRSYHGWWRGVTREVTPARVRVVFPRTFRS